MGDRYLNYATEITQLLQENQELDKQINVLQKRLKHLKKPSTYRSYSLFISLEARDAGEFILEASYVVSDANWLPLYDLQVNSQKQTIALDYLGEIKQNTGEDWLGVALTLSTAKPGLGSLPPKLNPWFDEGIQIERDLVERQVDKKLIGGQRRITFTYKLTATNLKDTAVNSRSKNETNQRSLRIF